MFFRCLLTVFLGSGLMTGLAAQTYRVYRAAPLSSAEDASADKSRTCIELSVSEVGSYGNFQDADGNSITRMMSGLRGKALIYLTEYLAVGVEGSTLKAFDMHTSLISKIRREEWGVFAKGILSPQTRPKIYILAGVGQAKQKTKFALRPETLHADTSVLMVGAGIDLAIWKNIHMSGEYQLRYDIHPWHNFILKSPRIRNELALGLSLQF